MPEGASAEREREREKREEKRREEKRVTSHVVSLLSSFQCTSLGGYASDGTCATVSAMDDVAVLVGSLMFHDGKGKEEREGVIERRF